MSRISLLPETPDNPEVKELFDEVLTRWPHVPNLYRTLGHSPEMFKAWLNVAWPLRMDAKTPRRTRHLTFLTGFLSPFGGRFFRLLLAAIVFCHIKDSTYNPTWQRFVQ